MSTRQRFNKWVSVPEQDRSPHSTQEAQELGLIEAALGEWDIKYPGPDEMIREDYVEMRVMVEGAELASNQIPPLASLVM